MEPNLTENRRQDKRHLLEQGFTVTVITYESDKKVERKAECKNLSFNGMGLSMKEPIAIQALVHIAVVLGEEDLGVLFYGRCVWSKAEEKTYQVGIHFIPDQDVLGKMKLLFSKLDQYIVPCFL